MEAMQKQEFRVRDLSTRSVTLFPTRAQVVRDIKNVALKPGATEITLVGLSPSVDEDSIKVEGTGSAIISDIAVELLPNRDIFEDIYPDSDNDESEDDSDGDHDDKPNKDGDALTAVREKLTLLRDDQKRAREVVASAESRLKILDSYGKMLDRKRGVDIDNGLDTYRTEREKIFRDHMDGSLRDRQVDKDIDELLLEEQRLLLIQIKEQKAAEKIKARARKAKYRDQEKAARRRAEKQKEKARIRKERESFWPRYCWSVRITLDAVNFTPSSSRRSSIASASDLVKLVSDKDPSSDASAAASYTCDLSLSYVVSSAWWTPSYDLALSTTSNTAMLCFDAQLTNKTSENWANCKIVLSTSQATFAGLQDAIPTLVPWRVRLGGRGYGSNSAGILDSREEREQKGGWQSQQSAWGAQKSRAHLYGVDNFEDHGVLTFAAPPQGPAPNPASAVLFASQQAPGAAPSTSFHASRSAVGGGGIFGSSSSAAPMKKARKATVVMAAAVPEESKTSGSVSSRGSLFRRTFASAPNPPREGGGADSYLGRAPLRDQAEAEEEEEEEEDDGETVLERARELSFQDSSVEEMGLTTTYDLPGLKTLNTGSTASKQRVARVSFTTVTFSHTVVAKYKPVAYLKARLKNASKHTLLKGPVGLTLDGSFMGRSTLPRCSAGESFTMSLGVDPAIDVVYPKPDVKRSTSGIFAQQDSSVYTRSVTLSNTRASAGKPIHLVVLDQVPVSEDERLRIVIVQPRGLVVGGSGVLTGIQGKEGKENADWGKATSTLKKAGEVTWDVTLNAGRSVKLVLEYEVAVPGGDSVIQC